MKILLSILFLSVFSATASAETHGLKKVSCTAVLGSTYQVVVQRDQVELVETWVATTPRIERITKIRHSFPLENCRFTPFSVKMSCTDSDSSSTKFSVNLKPKDPQQSYHEVVFNIQGVEEMESRTFETRRVEMGKAARCLVNDLFEVI
jgi:hypothetical protein